MGKKYNRMTEEIFSRIREEIKSGATILQACQNANVNWSSYYVWRKKLGFVKGAITKKRSRRRQALVVTDLPQTNLSKGELFIVFGPANSLAEFVKVYT